MEFNLYSVLDVPADADAVAIALAYARRLHDRRPNHLQATLTYAFLVLSDPRRRAAYDAALRELAPVQEQLPAR
ncbi:MAG TPA: hypothetical protein VFS21_14545 [Roseiflexaceae bacterium]|nr:hypothetical protein [Roseiflexaceae bacterium]